MLCDFLQDPDLFKPDRWAPDHPSAAKMKELFFPFGMPEKQEEKTIATENMIRENFIVYFLI